MSFLSGFVKQHPIISIVYFIYILLWLFIVRALYINYNLTEDAKFYQGEGLALGGYFMTGISKLYFGITILQVIFSKQNRMVYLKLLLFIFIPAFVISMIGLYGMKYIESIF